MAKYANDFGEERWVPLIGKLLADKEQFEVDDAIARQNDFSAFKEIEAPAEVELPDPDAGRAAWVELAVEHFGARRETLEPLDRTELIERFGQPEPEIVPPSVDAPREVWAAFVVQHVPGVELADLEDYDRSDLIAEIVPELPTTTEPAKNASTEVWAAYAQEHLGATPEDVAGRGRDELIDKYAAKEQ